MITIWIPPRRNDPAVPRWKKFVKAVHQFLDFFARCILCHESSFKVEELRLCLLCRHSDSRNQRPYKQEDCRLSCIHIKFVISSYSGHRVTSLLDYSLRSLHLSSCNLGPEFFSNKFDC
ncbi:hypothetical protein Droror1_Dr00013230 [Drosera rotundifolia]